MNRTRFAYVFAAAIAAVAVGAIATLTAPVVHADKISEKTIKTECAAAGGQYTTSTAKNGTSVSTCIYKDGGGDRVIDYYAGGHYVGTIPA